MIKLKSWADGKRGRISSLAKHLRVPYSFAFKMASGDKAIPMHHAAAIEHFTGHAVTRKDMFPDNWERIWPELADPQATPKES